VSASRGIFCGRCAPEQPVLPAKQQKVKAPESGAFTFWLLKAAFPALCPVFPANPAFLNQKPDQN